LEHSRHGNRPFLLAEFLKSSLKIDVQMRGHTAQLHIIRITRIARGTARAMLRSLRQRTVRRSALPRRLDGLSVCDERRTVLSRGEGAPYRPRCETLPPFRRIVLKGGEIELAR
jgi:hypothetical protein